MTKLHELTKHGQSIWYDNIRRALIDSGELQELIDAGVMGVTSNPSIFEKAIVGSADYDDAIQALAADGKSVEAIYEALVIEDIQRTADLLQPIYEDTNGVDGYVSLEVSPALAHDTKGTIAEARRLHAALNRPNVMIKVPATPAGIPAIEALIGEGIHINVTLIFGLNTYEAVAEAYIGGLENRSAGGGGVSNVASVASFFISRIDSAVDTALAELNNEALQGKIAIANAKMAFARSHDIFSGDRWRKLAGQGARVQRLLWASTGTKNPTYPDTLYLDELIGQDTVNTVPPATLNAFFDHGTIAATLGQGIDKAQSQLKQLAGLGIDLDAITQTLQDNGVAGFAESFASLMAGVAAKRDQLTAGWQAMSVNLNDHQHTVEAALTEIRDNRIIKRIWQHDHTVWRSDPTEITNRLGWLHSPEIMPEHVDRIMGLVEAVRGDGYTQVLLLGMGGSSLAPEMFANVFGESADGLHLAILDSTDPDMLLDRASELNLSKTLFIVATKSGGTAETLSAFKYFYNQLLKTMDEDAAGRHFIAITDPGSSLTDLAGKYKFRDTFLNDPNIGGRYSALSFFGLVPAALVGVDLKTLLERAQTAACNVQSCNCPVDGDNAGARLGVILGEFAKAGRDKATIMTSPAIAGFGDWVEQLIAESTGKDGTGILPVVGEAPGPPDAYGKDRLFVHIRLEDDDTHDAALSALEKAGHPLITLRLKDAYDIGGQLFLWEMATAVAGARLGIHPFDQPNVEAAKVLAREMVAEYMEKGTLPAGETAPLAADALNPFLDQAKPGDYVSIHAYVRPTPATDAALNDLRLRLRDKLKVATTVGYGPRFLHSTGQLHKGDGGNGLFIQFTSEAIHDVPIPDEAGRPEAAMTFGILKNAQALGDAQALKDAGRRVIRFHLGKNVPAALKTLSEGV